MSLRRKTFLLITAAAVILVVILTAMANIFLPKSFAELEKQSVQQDMERVVNILNLRISSIDMLTKDWATWDDTYAFMEDRNEDYVRINLTSETFTNARLNLIAYISSEGQLILARAFDLNERKPVPVPDNLYGHLSRSEIVRHATTRSRIMGILPAGETPMLFASRPILTSNAQGPISGTLIMGQFLSTKEINDIAEKALTPFSVNLFNASELAVELKEIIPYLSGDYLIASRPKDESSVTGYVVLKDVYERPYLVLKADIPRDIYAQGKMTLLWLIIGIVAACLVFMGLTCFSLERWILSRMKRMSTTVTNIAASGDISLRVLNGGHDELSVLAIEINTMLTKLSDSQTALQKSENKYATLVEKSNDGIVIAQDGIVKFVNTRMSEILSVRKEQLIGKPLTDVVSSGYKQYIVDHYNLKMAEKDAPDQYEVILCKQNGIGVPVEMSVSITEFEGRPAMIALIRDITERKKAEEKKIELEQKNLITSRLASVGEMASGIAHEINNPLTGVIGYSELLLERQDVPADVRKDLRIIFDGSRRVANIVKRLLTFARQTKPVKEYVNINDVIKATLELRAYNLEKDHIKVVTDLAPELPGTMADAGMLQQVFLNLIINAETEMKLSHDKGTLLIKTEQVDNRIKINFQDDGPGIARENLTKIFEPFFTTREVGQGTGLGLSVCHGIIVEHGGGIYAESELGNGAAFTVVLPIVAKPVQIQTTQQIVEEPQQSPKSKILIVDDELVVREVLRRILTAEGHCVETADNAEEALEKIRNSNYDFILLDIKMPSTSGIELYRILRGMPLPIANKIIFITGDVMSDDTGIFLSTTGAPFVTKPIERDKLLDCLNLMLT